MFDMGFQEVVLIGIIALIIIGPERLPAVARNIGKYVGKMQRFVAGVKSDIASELQTDELRSMLSSQEDQIRELKTMVKETQTDLEKTARQAQKSVSEGMDGAVAQVKDAADTAKDAAQTATETAGENSNKMQEIARAAGYNTYGDVEDQADSSSDHSTASHGVSKQGASGNSSASNSAAKENNGTDSKDQDSSQSA